MTVLDDYVTDVLMRDLVGHDRRPVSFLRESQLTAAWMELFEIPIFSDRS